MSTCVADRASQLLFEGVFDFLAGVFEAGFRLIALALILGALVAGDLADRFLRLTAKILGLILRLIHTAHSVCSYLLESARVAELRAVGTPTSLPYKLSSRTVPVGETRRGLRGRPASTRTMPNPAPVSSSGEVNRGQTYAPITARCDAFPN